jgi:putative oxidoreductase
MPFRRLKGIRGVKPLGRLFFAFPRGWAGAALLLLRAVPGAAIITEGIFYFTRADSALDALISGCLALAAGALLLAGFLTPIAAVLAAGTAAVGFLLLPASSANFFDSRSALVFAITMLIATACLGPGAFSVDARVFGRREIIIPPHHE